MNTKKIFLKNAITGMFMAIVMLCSCTRETEGGPNNDCGVKGISFNAEPPESSLVTRTTKSEIPSIHCIATNSRGDSLYLHTKEEIWSLAYASQKNNCSKAINTKVTPFSSTNSLTSVSLGVMAYSCPNEGASVESWTIYPEGNTSPIEAYYESGKWKPVEDIYYPGSGYLRFFAYAPFADGNINPAFVLPTAGVYPTMTYTVNNDYASQHDLLISTTEKVGNPTVDALDVSLPFEHALTGVSFKAIGGLSVSSVVISGVYDRGTLTLAPTGYSWSCSSTDKLGQTYIISSPATTSEGDYAVFSDEYTLMMIPQTLPTGARITVTLSDDTVVAADVSGHEWKRGKVVTYILSLAHVSFDDATDLTLWKSESATRTASAFGFPSTPTITYVSLDPSVAIVDSDTGEITAVNAGTATIHARASGGAPGTLTVYVNSVSDITLTAGTTNIGVGWANEKVGYITSTTITGSLTHTNNGTITTFPSDMIDSWNSSNPSYVTLSSTVLHPVSSQVTAMASPEQLGGVSSIQITVNSNYTISGSSISKSINISSNDQGHSEPGPIAGLFFAPGNAVKTGDTWANGASYLANLQYYKNGGGGGSPSTNPQAYFSSQNTSIKISSDSYGTNWRVPTEAELKRVSGTSTRNCAIIKADASTIISSKAYYSCVKITGLNGISADASSGDGVPSSYDGYSSIEGGASLRGFLYYPDNSIVIEPTIIYVNSDNDNTISKDVLDKLIAGGCAFLPRCGTYDMNSWEYAGGKAGRSFGYATASQSKYFGGKTTWYSALARGTIRLVHK